MTQLFIDGREVALPTGFSFVLTEENPYFTQAGQFSDEIEIPLAGININIFGHLNRRDVTIKGKTYDARIVVNNHALVVGTATVTAINSNTISLQILGNNSDVNYLTEFESTYIDEMDLGYACAGFSGYIYEWETKRVKVTPSETRNRGDDTTTDSDPYYITDDDIYDFSVAAEWIPTDEKISKLFNSSDNQNFVCLPALSTGGFQVSSTGRDGKSYIYDVTDVSINNFAFKIDRDYNWDSTDTIIFAKSYKAPQQPQWTDSALSEYVEGDANYIVPQPYLAYVIERFIEELGYTIDHSDLRSSWLKSVYIVNTTNTVFIQNMLPHWTAKQFMTEIEHFYGVVFWFNSKTKKCNITLRDNAFSSNTTRLNNVGDVFSIEVDEESTTDISNANVVIKYDDDLIHHFDETILNNAKEYECSGKTGVTSFFQNSETSDGTPVESCIALARQSTNTNERCRKYILKDETITQCNQMGDLIRGSNNDEIELNIQPAMVGTHEMYVIYPRHQSRGESWLIYKNDVPILTRSPKSPSVPLRRENINIGEYINGNEELTQNSIDKIYVSMFNGTINNGLYSGNGDKLSSKVVRELMGWCWEHDDLTGLHFTGHLDTIQLIGDTSLFTLSDNWNGINIDTTRKHTFTIYVDNKIDVRNVFVIDGKRYVCESVKYIIDENGLQKAAECVMYKFVE